MTEKGYGGLDIDFEFVFAYDAESYADFIAKARAALAPYGYTVYAALAPKTSASQPGLLYEGHLYDKIGAAADKVFLMTYEWGYTYGPPMAVAPINAVRRVLDYAVTEIPPEKLLWESLTTVTIGHSRTNREKPAQSLYQTKKP